ncbi:hypothetical protein V498_10079 [Pseudogymnoascus sp. VKM F-4517 (FW-2822)]|nr:hypothetical protein V498_10079 [Pseudogymnoascus sp. VKM F-4517 (FW-2822)]
MDKAMKVTALKWLRRNIVVNERQSAGRRAEIELAAMGEDVATPGAVTEEYNPQNESSSNSKSVLDAVREAKEKEWEEKVAKRDALRVQRMAEMGENSGGLTTHDDRGVELRRPGENDLLKHYTALAAKVVPEVPPDSTTFQRLWPSALATLAVIAGCVDVQGRTARDCDSCAPNRLQRLYIRRVASPAGVAGAEQVFPLRPRVPTRAGGAGQRVQSPDPQASGG